MKTTIMALSLLATIFSTSAHAHYDLGTGDLLSITTVGSPLFTTKGTFGVTSDNIKGNAEKVLNDGQSYLNNGELSLFLADAVRNVQAVYSDASQDEIIDALMNESEDLLNN